MSIQRFTPEFKAEAVRQVIERGYSVAEIAARFGVSTHSLYKWVKAVTPDKSEKQASELLEAKSEILRLRAQMRRLEEERDILKNRAAHHILHGVLDARVHARRDGYVDDLGHQVALTGIRLGADQGVAPVAHYGLFLRLHTVWIQVRREQVWIAAAVKGWPSRLGLVGRAAGEQ